MKYGLCSHSHGFLHIKVTYKMKVFLERFDHSPPRVKDPILQDVVKEIAAFADTGNGEENLPETGHEHVRPGSPTPSSRSHETDVSACTG